MVESKRRRAARFVAPVAAQQIRQTLVSFLEARLRQGRRLCVGLSGGRDSLVLLHALAGLRASGSACELSAVHVHHGLSANADVWSDFCTDFCRRCAVPIEVVRVEVPRASGEGLEAASRRLRHAAFAACDADWLALAHHRDDQAETIVFRLLRGSGVSGAAGMPAERPQRGGARLIRPLLEVPGSLIARYAEESSLLWIEDESNADLRYRRNYLRHAVMPGITRQFPGAVQALVRAGQHFNEAALLLDELAKTDRVAIASARGRIDLAGLNALSGPRARNLLRFELLSAGFRAPETRWLREAQRQLATAGSDSETCVATLDGEIHVYRGDLYVVPRRPAVPGVPLPWRGEAALRWGAGRVTFTPTIGKGISRRQLASAEVCLRARQGGERLRPDPRRPTKTLGKWLQEAALPPWERLRLPLLCCGERLVWAAEVGVDVAFACAPAEPGLALAWENDERRDD